MRMLTKTILAIIFALLLTSCGVQNTISEPSSAFSSSGYSEASDSETVQSLFVGYIAQQSFESAEVEYLGEELVQGEVWYKFRVTTPAQSEGYLANKDLSLVYASLHDDTYGAEMKEVYHLYEGSAVSLSEDTRSSLFEQLFAVAFDEIGEEVTGWSEGVKIINQEFCFMMGAGYSKDFVNTYIAAYAISLDGERSYKLGDDGYFHSIG